LLWMNQRNGLDHCHFNDFVAIGRDWRWDRMDVSKLIEFIQFTNHDPHRL
jgi:hypothetical protein